MGPRIRRALVHRGRDRRGREPPAVRSRQGRVRDQRQHDLAAVERRGDRLEHPRDQKSQQSQVRRDDDAPRRHHALQGRGIVAVGAVRRQQPDPHRQGHRNCALPRRHRRLQQLGMAALRRRLRNLPDGRRLAAFQRVRCSRRAVSRRGGGLRRLRRQASVRMAAGRCRVGAPADRPHVPAEAEAIRRPAGNRVAATAGRTGPRARGLVDRSSPRRIGAVRHRHGRGGAQLSRIPIPRRHRILA